MNPTTILRRAAEGRRRISVLTPEGRLVGYLAGLDETHVALYAQYVVPQKGEAAQVVWSITVVPRTMAMIIEDQTIMAEPQDVQSVYQALAQEFLDMIDDLMRREDRRKEEG